MTAKTADITLAAQSRSLTGKKTKQLRNEGTIPAVVYGHNKEARNLSLNQHDFELLFQQAGYSTLLNLKIDDERAFKVLIHDVQVDPVKHHILHADFYQVNLKEKVTTEVPLSFVGVSDAVEIQGGTFLTQRDEVEIECLPENLVKELEVDITAIKTFDDTITIGDLVAPEGITILGDPEQVIASVAAPRSEEELSELDEAPSTETETEFETSSGTDAAATEEAK